jgi:nicotinate-nucleotide--dimethylbenzimidazole phosphoribosyltransferase
MIPVNSEIKTADDIRSALINAPAQDAASTTAAAERNSQLTKPPGALGRLEDLAIWYCGWRRDAKAQVTNPQVIVFAGNHGVAARGVSAFPPEVTEQMVLNFQHGGAAINQLSRNAGATLNVHALSLDKPTADFTERAAMTEIEFDAALCTGWDAVNPKADLLVVGEMGIGNTTSAAAIACALFGGSANDWVGRGTGVTDDGLKLKAEVVTAGVDRAATATDGLETLRELGGREIAAMAGAMAHARVLGLPVVLDGFICTAAAACLEKTVAGSLDHTVAGHLSAEGAHARMLDTLGKQPLLSLGLRLGEGSGGALAITIVKAALATHSGMATFAEASVAGG